MAEWSKAPDSKSGLGQPNGGSNPSLSATPSTQLPLERLFAIPGMSQSKVTHLLLNAAVRYAAVGILGLVFQGYVWAAQSASAKTWDRYTSDFIEATFKARPHFAVWAGRHEFDGQLPDWSPAGIKKEVGRLHEARSRALAFRDGMLNEKQRFERDYVVATIDRDLFWLETAEWPWRSPTFYSWGLDPQVYITREYAPLTQRMQAYIAYAKAIPRAVEQIRGNLRTPLPSSYVRIGHISARGLASLYQNDVPAIFASVDDAGLQAEFRTANDAAISAMKALDAWLTEQEAGATERFALGPEKFAAMLRATERIDVPLPRLKEIAERDLERNLAAMREACHAIAPGQTIEACVATVNADKMAGSPVEGATKQLVDLRAFVEEKKLVSIPGPERARVAESLPYERWNAAYIRIPGPFERNLPATYYISPPDPKWSKAEQEAYIPGKNDLLFISAHEVWPGHFLQFQHSHRSASTVGRLFVSYTFSEGWAHYAEELMWEAGLGAGDPAVHVGQLQNALLRNVRLLSAIGLHTGSMSVAASEAIFREKAFQDPGNARQQADRGTFDPGYGAYTLGKLMIRKLREDWAASHGGRQAWQAFHDQFLSYGSPPVPMVRKAMLGTRSGPPL